MTQKTFLKAPMKVLLLENIHPSAQEIFQTENFIVERVHGSVPQKELLKQVAAANIIGIRSKTQLPEEVLSAATDLLCVGCFCIGTNQVDLEAANRLAIPVFNAPFSNTRSVAELIIAEIVMLARRLGDCVRELHRGQWNKSATGCHEIRGKTLGVVGYGHIGSQVGVLAESFGMRVIFYDIAKKLPMGNNRSVVDLKTLLANSDFTTFHVPATAETNGMIQEQHLKTMRRGSYLINASRGSVVDLQALADAIKSEHIAGAAIDVYPKEPRKNCDPFESPLMGLRNVVLTPHIGGSTEEAQESIGQEVGTACLDFVTKGSTASAVNFPQVELPLRPGTHRILNVHRNVPGVMADLLKVLSGLGANIHAQHLATDDTTGYLITDLDTGVSEEAYRAISRLETSIKTRILY